MRSSSTSASPTWLRTGRAPRTSVSSDRSSSQSAYHDAQSGSSPSVMRNTVWWDSAASWRRSATRATGSAVTTQDHLETRAKARRSFGGSLLHLLHVSHHRVAHDLQLLGRAELKVFGARLGARRNVPSVDVEGVSGLEDLFVVPAVERQTALEHVAPMRTRTLVVGQSLEQRSRIHVLAHGEELDRGVREILAALFHGAVVLDVRRRARALRHCPLLLDSRELNATSREGRAPASTDRSRKL